MQQKKMICEILLCQMTPSNNPAQIPVEFILHDFDYNWNKVRVSKEVAEKASPTLKGMAIVCKYYPVSEAGANDDALGGHGAILSEDRKGNVIVKTETVAIGSFTEDAYIETVKVVDNSGEEVEKEVVKGKGVLWASRQPDIIALLQEWWNSGIKITSSVELLYDSYTVTDGYEDILNYVYEGHCVLNSEDRGGHDIVHPAYDVSYVTQFQKLVAEAVLKQHSETQQQKNNLDKEDKRMELFRKVFELSHDDIRTLLYQQLQANLTEEEYNYCWIPDVYETYFITSMEGGYFKFNFTKENDEITIDFDSKVKVKEKSEWVEIESTNGDNGTQSSQSELQNENPEIPTSTEPKNETASAEESNGTEEKIQTLQAEKENVEQKFNEATEKLTNLSAEINSLKAEIDVLKPIKEKYEKEQYDKALDEKMKFYAGKFDAVKAKEVFETEEVQNLVKLSVNENEEGLKAKLQLNEKLVDLVQPVEEVKPTVIKEHASRMDNLIPNSNSFDDRYSE